MTPFLSRRRRLVLVVVLITTSALAAWLTTPRRGTPRAAVGPGATGEIVLALAGDAAVSIPLDLDGPPLRAIGALVRRASLGLVNFELAPSPLTPAVSDAPARWPAATPAAAADLRQLGFGAVSLANNHTFDAGADGLTLVQAQLDAAGVAHAGAGANLDAARRAAYVATPGGTVALVSIAVSHAAGARATARLGDINGRPGVNGVRFARRLAVDDAAFVALTAAFPPSALKRNPDGVTWDLLGITVVRDERAGMALVADPSDLDTLVTAVREARGQAAAVVVSLHAHEPGNGADDVPDLLRGLAHAAIEAGADVVYGHGPHRLRGVELYRERPIFYSLGNFVFPDRALRPEAADEFEDHGRNVLSPFGADAPPRLDFTGDAWWQSAIAVVRLEGGRVSRIELHPIDVGVGQDAATRGVPALARPALGAKILERLRGLSAPLGTSIAIEHGIGVVSGTTP